MISLDTNLLARLLLRDDVEQHARVEALLRTDQIFTAPSTVFLELVWMLEANDTVPADISRGLTKLLGLPNFSPPDSNAIRQALRAYEQGIDFADSLHLALSSSHQSMMTFDKAFVRRAGKLGLTPQVVAA